MDRVNGVQGFLYSYIKKIHPTRNPDMRLFPSAVTWFVCIAIRSTENQERAVHSMQAKVHNVLLMHMPRKM